MPCYSLSIMQVNARFTIQTGSQQFVDEANLAATNLQDIQDVDPLFGQLIISSDGQADLTLHDDLEYLFGAIFNAIEQASTERQGMVWFSDSPAELKIEKIDNRMRISSAQFPVFEFPVESLLATLRACCMRYIAFARTAYSKRADIQARLNELEMRSKDGTAGNREKGLE